MKFVFVLALLTIAAPVVPGRVIWPPWLPSPSPGPTFPLPPDDFPWLHWLQTPRPMKRSDVLPRSSSDTQDVSQRVKEAHKHESG